MSKWTLLTIVATLVGCEVTAQVGSKPSEEGYNLERFDSSGMKVKDCDYGHHDYGSIDTYSYSCWYAAPDGTRWYVSKYWDRPAQAGKKGE